MEPSTQSCVYDLLEFSHLKGTLTSVTICNSSLSEVPMSLVLSETVTAAVNEHGDFFSNLPYEPFLAIGIQSTLYRPIGQGSEVMDPGIYNSTGFMPLSGLPVPVGSPEFVKFWGFLAEHVGATISWHRGNDDNSITVSILGERDAPVHTFKLEPHTVRR